jgi:hypothetical protein
MTFCPGVSVNSLIVAGGASVVCNEPVHETVGNPIIKLSAAKRHCDSRDLIWRRR